MGADNDTPIFSESPRGNKLPARYDPAPVVPPISVAFVGYWWRVHHVDGGVVHAADSVLRVPRVDSVVHARCRNLSRGVLTLSIYL